MSINIIHISKTPLVGAPGNIRVLILCLMSILDLYADCFRKIQLR